MIEGARFAASLAVLLTIAACFHSIEAVEVDESWIIRGAPLSSQSLYMEARRLGRFRCLSDVHHTAVLQGNVTADLDSEESMNKLLEFMKSHDSLSMPFENVNDNYCDCADGSDEPSTDACAFPPSPRLPNEAGFYCLGSRRIFSSRVDDGICDCCDGSDEVTTGVSCQWTCTEGDIEHSKSRQTAILNGFRKRLEHLQYQHVQEEEALHAKQRVETVAEGPVRKDPTPETGAKEESYKAPAWLKEYTTNRGPYVVKPASPTASNSGSLYEPRRVPRSRSSREEVGLVLYIVVILFAAMMFLRFCYSPRMSMRRYRLFKVD